MKNFLFISIFTCIFFYCFQNISYAYPDYDQTYWLKEISYVENNKKNIIWKGTLPEKPVRNSRLLPVFVKNVHIDNGINFDFGMRFLYSTFAFNFDSQNKRFEYIPKGIQLTGSDDQKIKKMITSVRVDGEKIYAPPDSSWTKSYKQLKSVYVKGDPILFYVPKNEKLIQVIKDIKTKKSTAEEDNLNRWDKDILLEITFKDSTRKTDEKTVFKFVIGYGVRWVE